MTNNLINKIKYIVPLIALCVIGLVRPSNVHASDTQVFYTTGIGASDSFSGVYSSYLDFLCDSLQYYQDKYGFSYSSNPNYLSEKFRDVISSYGLDIYIDKPVTDFFCDIAFDKLDGDFSLYFHHYLPNLEKYSFNTNIGAGFNTVSVSRPFIASGTIVSEPQFTISFQSQYSTYCCAGRQIDTDTLNSYAPRTLHDTFYELPDRIFPERYFTNFLGDSDSVLCFWSYTGWTSSIYYVGLNCSNFFKEPDSFIVCGSQIYGIDAHYSVSPAVATYSYYLTAQYQSNLTFAPFYKYNTSFANKPWKIVSDDSVPETVVTPFPSVPYATRVPTPYPVDSGLIGFGDSDVQLQSDLGGLFNQYNNYVLSFKIFPWFKSYVDYILARPEFIFITLLVILGLFSYIIGTNFKR